MTDRRAELLVASLLVGVGLILRFWALGAKGLSYDEAATAIMARATPLEILRFHWTATFENPPLWQLIMHYWSRGFGQSEPMLRLLPALAGTLALAATWWWLYLLWPGRRGLRLVTLGLVAAGPVLVQYSQEARSYALLLLGSALSLAATVMLARRPSWRTAGFFVVVTWFCTGLHYYALILVGAETIFLFVHGLLRRASLALWALWAGALLLAVLPIGAWMAFAPGFRLTAGLIAAARTAPQPDVYNNLLDLARNLTVGSFRWAPPHPYWFLWLAPLIALGMLTLARADSGTRHTTRERVGYRGRCVALSGQRCRRRSDGFALRALCGIGNLYAGGCSHRLALAAASRWGRSRRRDGRRGSGGRAEPLLRLVPKE